MQRRWLSLVLLGALGLHARPAMARVDIRVDLASQTMRVAGAEGRFLWPISSARLGYRTPRGTFGVRRMEAMHRSHRYANAPMPHSLFFSGGYAIHGTDAIAALGAPASHGCIRLAPGHAAALYRMVRTEGARITIVSSRPEDAGAISAAALRPHHASRFRVRPRDDDAWPSWDDGGAGAAFGDRSMMMVEPDDGL